MCGRYAATARPDDLVEEFEVEQDLRHQVEPGILVAPQQPPAGAPDFNMAPTKQAPVILARPERQLRLLTWGLVPSWARDIKVGLRLINARGETLFDKPAFARTASSRRCLVPAQGWFEWRAGGAGVAGADGVAGTAGRRGHGTARRQPYFVHRRDGRTVAMAGIYEFWRRPGVAADDPAAWLTTFAVITTAADPELAWLHDRQPLVLEPDAWAQWLDPEVASADEVRRHLGFARAGRFEVYPVSTSVNSARSNGPALIAPLR